MVRVLSAFLVSIATAALVTSCGQATGASNTDGEASLTIGTPQIRSSNGWVRGTIPLVITNTGESTVVFSECGTTLERSVDGTWQTLNGIVCALGASTGDVEIPPKSQYAYQYPVGTVLAGTHRLKSTLQANNKLFVRVTEAFPLGT